MLSGYLPRLNTFSGLDSHTFSGFDCSHLRTFAFSEVSPAIPSRQRCEGSTKNRRQEKRQKVENRKNKKRFKTRKTTKTPCAMCGANRGFQSPTIRSAAMSAKTPTGYSVFPSDNAGKTLVSTTWTFGKEFTENVS